MSNAAAFLTALLMALLPASADPPRHDGDLPAASPNDDDTVAPAVTPEEMEVDGAIQACRKALDEFPSIPRFEAQPGNALYSVNPAPNDDPGGHPPRPAQFNTRRARSVFQRLGSSAPSPMSK